MQFPEPLLPATLLRRYKRFLADVRFPDGTELTVHCPNPGAMTGCLPPAESPAPGPGWPALISRSSRPGRKLAYTLELVHNGLGWIGVNPALANAVVEEALRAGAIPGLRGYPEIRREIPYGSASAPNPGSPSAFTSRIDFLLAGAAGKCYVEVKSATLVDADGYYAFPDAVTARGLKHIRELEAAVREGHRAVLLFLIQRSDGGGVFRAAGDIDPAYALGLDAGFRNGVEVLPFLAEVGPEGIRLGKPVPFQTFQASPAFRE